MPMGSRGLWSLFLACASLPKSLAHDEFVIGVYGPFTSVTGVYLGTAVAAFLDFQKNLDPSSRTRFGDPIISIPNLHPDLKIRLQLATSNSDSGVGMSSILNLIDGKGTYLPINSLVGGYHSAISMPIATIAAVSKLPQTAWGSTSPKLSNKAVYPFFIRTSTPDSIQAKGMWAWIKKNAIPIVAVIYTLEPFGEGLYSALASEAVAAGEGFRVVGVGMPRQVGGEGNYDNSIAKGAIGKAKAVGTKFVIVIEADSSGSFMRNMKEEGLFDGAYSIFGSHATPAGSDTAGFLKLFPQNAGPLMPKFARMWENMTVDDVLSTAARSKYGIDQFLTPLDPSAKGMPTAAEFADHAAHLAKWPHGPLLFDAIYAQILAANSLLNKQHPMSEIKGQLLLDELKGLSFEGISGPISFDRNGDRLASYNVLNMQPDGAGATQLKSVGVYAASTGQFTLTSDLFWTSSFQGATAPSWFFACAPGFYTDRNNVCQACTGGTYSEGGANAVCQKCPKGMQPNVSAGSDGAVNCRACSPGTYADQEGIEVCLRCSPGYFTNRSNSSSCQRCPLGRYSASLESRECDVCPGVQTTNYLGATSSSECGCGEGYHELVPVGATMPTCVKCGRGLDCKFDNEVSQKQGYWAVWKENGWSVWRCFGNSLRCPRGAPGTCAYGRTGLACGTCMQGYTESTGGTCEQCSSGEKAPFILVTVALVVLVIVGYHIIDTEDKTKQNNSVLFVAILGSQSVTYLQMLGVMAMMELQFLEPLHSLMSVVKLFGFNIEVLKLGCIASVSDLGRYRFKAFVCLIFIAAAIVVHVAFVLVRYGGRFRERTPSLIGFAGTVMTVFFTSTVIAILAPFQCQQHPNKAWTVRSYSLMVCWESGDHTNAMVVAGFALLTPLAFIAMVVYVARVYPKRVRAGDAAFLRWCSFLMFRFKAGLHWYAVVLLGRSLILSLLPILPDPLLQVLGVQGLLVISMGMAVHYTPWKVKAANYIDIACLSLMLLGLPIMVVFIEDTNFEAIAVACSVFIFMAATLLPAAAICGVANYFFNKMRKPYKYFLCHHKAAAGAFARMMKQELVQEASSTMGVFLDSDNLKDLDDLFDVVRCQTESLVVLTTEGVLHRAWCMGEICTAHLNGVNVVPIYFDGVSAPDEEFVAHYAERAAGLDMLVERGFSLSLITRTLEHFAGLRAGLFVDTTHTYSMVKLCKDLPGLVKHLRGERTSESTGASLSGATISKQFIRVGDSLCPPVPPGSELFVVANPWDSEAMASARVLVRYLQPCLHNGTTLLPQIAEEGHKIPASAQVVILLCTKDLFHNVEILRHMLSIIEHSCSVLPVLADSEFVIPTTLCISQHIMPLARQNFSSGNAELLAQGIAGVFQEIAVIFNPKDYSATDAVLMTKANEIASRIHPKHARRQLTDRVKLDVFEF